MGDSSSFAARRRVARDISTVASTGPYRKLIPKKMICCKHDLL